jgi:hypothetical protein
MFNIVTLLSSALLVSQVVSATTLQGRGSFIQGLVARQAPTATIPSQCQTQCQAINTVDACSDIACMCTSAVDQGLHTCISCIAGLGGTSASTAGLLDEFESTCAEAGFPIAGSSATSGLTTAAASASTVIGTGSGLSATLPAAGTTAANAKTTAAATTGVIQTIAQTIAQTTPQTTAQTTAKTTSTGNPFGKSGGAFGLKCANVGVLGSVVMVVLGAGFVMA